MIPPAGCWLRLHGDVLMAPGGGPQPVPGVLVLGGHIRVHTGQGRALPLCISQGLRGTAYGGHPAAGGLLGHRRSGSSWWISKRCAQVQAAAAARGLLLSGGGFRRAGFTGRGRPTVPGDATWHGLIPAKWPQQDGGAAASSAKRDKGNAPPCVRGSVLIKQSVSSGRGAVERRTTNWHFEPGGGEERPHPEGSSSRAAASRWRPESAGWIHSPCSQRDVGKAGIEDVIEVTMESSSRGRCAGEVALDDWRHGHHIVDDEGRIGAGEQLRPLGHGSDVVARRMLDLVRLRYHHSDTSAGRSAPSAMRRLDKGSERARLLEGSGSASQSDVPMPRRARRRCCPPGSCSPARSGRCQTVFIADGDHRHLTGAALGQGRGHPGG